MKKLVFIIALGLGIQPVFSQSIYSSSTPNIFNVRAYSYAGAYSAAVNESSALYYNPGALGTFRKFSMNISTYLQFNTSSFNEDNAPSYISSQDIEEREMYIRPDFLGLTLPLGESGFTIGAAYMRMFDQSFHEKWTINKSSAPDEIIELGSNAGIHNLALGLGKAFTDEDEDLQFGLGTTMNYMYGQNTLELTQNGAKVLDESGTYNGVMFRHGMVLKSESAGLSLVYESPWQRNRSGYDEMLIDSVYSIINFAPMVSIGGYAGGSGGFRFHMQYDHRFVPQQQIFQGFNGTDYVQAAPYDENTSMNAISLSLESGAPNESGIRYSFRYSNYPVTIDNEKMYSLMGVFGAGGPIGDIDDLILDFVIGFEYFPRHFNINYGSGENLMHKATYWRVGLSLSHRGFSQF